MIWKRGSLLKKNGHRALITQTRDNELMIKCQGLRPENILFVIHETYETLIQESFQESFQDVHYDFSRVPCPEYLKVRINDTLFRINFAPGFLKFWK